MSIPYTPEMLDNAPLLPVDVIAAPDDQQLAEQAAIGVRGEPDMVTPASPQCEARAEMPLSHPEVEAVAISVGGLIQNCPHYARLAEINPGLARAQASDVVRRVQEQASMRQNGVSDEAIQKQGWASMRQEHQKKVAEKNQSEEPENSTRQGTKPEQRLHQATPEPVESIVIEITDHTNTTVKPESTQPNLVELVDAHVLPHDEVGKKETLDDTAAPYESAGSAPDDTQTKYTTKKWSHTTTTPKMATHFLSTQALTAEKGARHTEAAPQQIFPHADEVLSGIVAATQFEESPQNPEVSSQEAKASPDASNNPPSTALTVVEDQPFYMPLEPDKKLEKLFEPALGLMPNDMPEEEGAGFEPAAEQRTVEDTLEENPKGTCEGFAQALHAIVTAPGHALAPETFANSDESTPTAEIVQDSEAHGIALSVAERLIECKTKQSETLALLVKDITEKAQILYNVTVEANRDTGDAVQAELEELVIALFRQLEVAYEPRAVEVFVSILASPHFLQTLEFQEPEITPLQYEGTHEMKFDVTSVISSRLTDVRETTEQVLGRLLLRLSHPDQHSSMQHRGQLLKTSAAIV